MPAPAISGKASGTTDAVGRRIVFLIKLDSKNHFKAKKKITNEPAMAKSLTVIPINLRIFRQERGK